MYRLISILCFIFLSCTFMQYQNIYVHEHSVEGVIPMGTDHAQGETATYTTLPNTTVNNISNVNDNNDGTWCSTTTTVGFDPKIGGATLTILFSADHNINTLRFRVERLDVGVPPPAYATFTFYYKYAGGWVQIGTTVSPTSATNYDFILDKRIEGIRVITTCSQDQIPFASSTAAVYTMEALGYDSSGKLKIYGDSVADQTDLTGMKVRYYDGSQVMGVPLMEAYVTGYAVYDGSEVKSLAVVD